MDIGHFESNLAQNLAIFGLDLGNLGLFWILVIDLAFFCILWGPFGASGHDFLYLQAGFASCDLIWPNCGYQGVNLDHFMNKFLDDGSHACLS